jgi:hypothetical protein
MTADDDDRKHAPIRFVGVEEHKAALRWVIDNGFDPQRRARYTLAKLEGRPTGPPPPARSPMPPAAPWCKPTSAAPC